MSGKGIYVSAEKAVEQIRDGDRVVIGHACGEPRFLVKAFTDRLPALKGIQTVHMVGLGESAYCRPELAANVRHNSIFVGGKERKAIQEGRADYTPRYFSEIPALFYDGSLPPDIALIQVSRPNKHGYVSLGVSVDYTMEAARRARLVIAQVNANMPWTHGESFLHVSDIDYLVERDEPIIELPRGELSEEDRQIGRNCAELVPDGATLQLGIGSLPDAVLLSLTDKNDLGIHSEMFSDGVMDLVEKGIVTNKRKTLHPGKMVATFIMGTRKLYDFIDDNPSVYMSTVDYVNDPRVICQNDSLISINSCVQVDLMGQVCSESVGLTQISSVGGQVDFIRGARMSKGGKSLLVFASTAKNGEVSKIVPFLDQGAAVTTNRYDVNYIVTEYGSACLQGKCLRDRGRALIEIAHPKFRPALREEWERRFHMKY